MEVKPGYKLTEVGMIPENWEVKRLGEIANLNYGYTTSANSKQIGPKFLRITDIQDNHVHWDLVPFCQCGDADLLKYQLQTGDIVFARTGATTGKSLLIIDPPKAIFASYLIRLRISNFSQVIPGYLIAFSQTKAYWDCIAKGSSGSAQGGFNASKLAQIPIPLPPLPEQRAIATILSDMDAEIAMIQRQREKYSAIQQGMLQELLTGRTRLPL